MKVIKEIKITGISEKGTKRVMTYCYPFDADNDFQAIARAISWANDEYTCEYDENYKPILNSDYKEFVKITSIEVIE